MPCAFVACRAASDAIRNREVGVRTVALNYRLTGRAAWPGIVTLYAVLLASLHMAMTSPWRLATLTKLASFEAAEPFQHRILLPAMVAAVQQILPLGELLLFALAEVAGWVALILVAEQALKVFRIGATQAVRRALALTVVIPMGLHLIVPELVPYPGLNVDGGVLDLGNWRAQRLFYYVYDLPAAVFTLALVVLMALYARTRERRWLTGYLALFAVATLNRETTLFLIPCFAVLLFQRVEHLALVRALALQVGLFVAIQGLLQWTFADQVNPNAGVPGTQYENHLIANLALFTNPFYLLTYLARFGAGLYLPIILLRRHLDPFLGPLLICFAVPFLASAFFFGRIVEQRVVIELVPLLWLGGLQVLAALHASRRSPSPSGSGRSPAAGPAGRAMPARHARWGAGEGRGPVHGGVHGARSRSPEGAQRRARTSRNAAASCAGSIR